MNNIKFLNIAILISLLSVLSCTDSDKFKVETLGKFGTEFYCGENVVVWAAVQTDDLNNISYEWSCDGGSLLAPPGRFENTWKAPSIPGVYTVKVKVKSGSVVEERETKMNVSYYFFDNFQNTKNIANWRSDNGKMTFDINKEKVLVTASGTSIPNFRRDLFEIPLTIPFSILYNMGFDKFKDATSNIQHRITFNQPDNKQLKYIREIRFQMIPKAVGTTKNFLVQFEYFLPYTNKSKWTNIVDVNSPNGLIAENVYEYYSMSIGQDSTFYIYRNGIEILKSNQIKDSLSRNSPVPNTIKEFRVQFPTATNMWFDDVYISNNGSLLKTRP